MKLKVSTLISIAKSSIILKASIAKVNQSIKRKRKIEAATAGERVARRIRRYARLPFEAIACNRGQK